MQTQSLSALHTERHCTSEYVQSSGFSMLTIEGMYADSGYVQSSAVSRPIEPKDVPTNVFNNRL